MLTFIETSKRRMPRTSAVKNIRQTVFYCHLKGKAEQVTESVKFSQSCMFEESYRRLKISVTKVCRKNVLVIVIVHAKECKQRNKKEKQLLLFTSSCEEWLKEL